MKKAVYKVPQGKLLKIFLDEDDFHIRSIKITGDFFLHPEENIERLETALNGAPLTQEDLTARINGFLAKNETMFFGIDVNSLVSTILAAAGQLDS